VEIAVDRSWAIVIFIQCLLDSLLWITITLKPLMGGSMFRGFYGA